MSVRGKAWLGLSLAGFVGCGASIQIAGHDLAKAHWEEDLETVKTRGAFDLQCPKESLEASLLAVDHIIDDRAGQIGVVGCGRQAVYVRLPYTGWVMNSGENQKAKAP